MLAAAGWKYLFHILDACLGFQLILVFFFVPETAYERDVSLDIDQNVDDSYEEKVAVEKLEHSTEVTRTTSRSAPPPKKTFWESLAIWTGKHSDENLIPLLVAPLAVNLNLGALWMVVVTGMLSSFYVSQSFVAAQIFAFPPYSLNAAGVGFMFVGPFLGGLIGSVVLVSLRRMKGIGRKADVEAGTHHGSAHFVVLQTQPWHLRARVPPYTRRPWARRRRWARRLRLRRADYRRLVSRFLSLGSHALRHGRATPVKTTMNRKSLTTPIDLRPHARQQLRHRCLPRALERNVHQQHDVQELPLLWLLVLR